MMTSSWKMKGAGDVQGMGGSGAKWRSIRQDGRDALRVSWRSMGDCEQRARAKEAVTSWCRSLSTWRMARQLRWT